LPDVGSLLCLRLEAVTVGFSFLGPFKARWVAV
jgi:hypothetical protein